MANEPAGTKAIVADQSAGKYYRIDVPDWTTATHGGDGSFTEDGVARSYLRIGATPGAEPGDDLADLVKAVDLSNAKDEAAKLKARAAASFEGAFLDDARTRDDDSPSPDARTAVTAKLRTQSGWRDHADGNRITTTRGDKIEVIRGNYKLLVLGRQDDPGSGAWWEASGGLIQDNDIAPGAISSISYEKNPWGGTWKVVEEFAKADVVTRYHGNCREEFYGDRLETIIGSSADSDLVGFEAPSNSDPAQTKQSKPDISETIHAGDITERTVATKIDTHVRAGTLSEMVNVGTLSELATVAVATRLALVGVQNEVHIGGERGEVAILRYGYEYNMGKRASYNFTKADYFNLDTTETTISELKTKVSASETALATTTTAISDANKSIQKTQDSVTALTSAVTRTDLAVTTKMSSLTTSLAAMKTDIGNCVQKPPTPPVVKTPRPFTPSMWRDL